ncbi:MAG: alanine--tRNA ligase [Thermoplasmata archaeon]|nr:alanine--tRNA ligase [Thermoplasmata archaeon]
MAFGDIEIPFFIESGFVRKKCRVTKQWFWTRDGSRDTCGDTTEDEYTFIGSPLIPGFPERGKALMDKMRETFLSFFEEQSHSRIAPYPVIARWRDDIHLTIASIADFQPDVTGGVIPPPANPLTISQPCIRLTDVAAVGRSGRHLTTFEMMAHHCFNRPKDGQTIYWIDECVRFCDELFVNRLGINPNEITYVENPWSGGGNAGPAVEVIVGGLELATLVFMNLEEDPDGEIEIKGEKYSEMDLQIIDTGYGLERFCWAAAGTPTIYEAIFPESVSLLRRLSGFDERLEKINEIDSELVLSELSMLAGILNIDVGTDVSALYEKLVERLAERGVSISLSDLKSITEPLSAIYAIPDHLHGLCNMLGDGLVPSNVKAGYLARMLARRTLKLRDELGIDVPLSELGKHHLEVNLKGRDFIQTRDGIIKILDLEEQRYREMLRAGEAAVRTALKETSLNATEIDDDIFIQLAESRGLQPDMVIEIAKNEGWNNLEVRVGLEADMAARHAKITKESAKKKNQNNLLETNHGFKETIKEFYLDTSKTEFDAQVIDCFELTNEKLSNLNLSNEVEGKPSHGVILDKTLFYPEGGGQLSDFGTLTNGKTVRVLDSRSESGIIIHLTDGEIQNGKVSGKINSIRRNQLMDHHTSVHIVGGSARAILGPHIWQAGSNKGEKYARLDITHFERLTRNQLNQIEDHANNVIESDIAVQKLVLDRAEADSEFGFNLYQGGPPKHQQVRIIKIGQHDIQACGGTHHDSTGKIGEVRIIRSSAVQDGVERLQIVAGETAREHARTQERLLSEASEVLGVQAEELPATVQRFFEEWKSQKKEIEQLESEIVRLRTSGGGSDSVVKDGIRYAIMEGSGDMRQLLSMVQELTRDPQLPTVAILGTKEGGGKLLVAITENSLASETHNAIEILNSISSHISGGGGGKPTFAQGGGSNPDGLENALNAARDLLKLE